MKAIRSGSYYFVRRTANEPRCTSESNFWYRLRNHLRTEGLDVVKKNPQKDGHMLSAPYYLRERKWKFAIEDDQAALRLVHLDFNSREPVHLRYHNWEGKES